MKRLILSAALALSAVPAHAADPTEAVQFFYNDPGSELSTENRDRFAGKAKDVLDAADKEAESDNGPCIDFMLSVDGQDFDDDELKKSLNLAGAIAGDTATVKATFKQFGEDAEIIWSLEKAGDDWKISDIASVKNDWKLTGIDCSPIPAQ